MKPKKKPAKKATRPRPETPKRKKLPAKAKPKARAKRSEAVVGWHPPDDFALIPFGFTAAQVARVLEVGPTSALVQKWAHRTKRWQRPTRLPIGRLMGRPAPSDHRLLAAKDDLARSSAIPAPAPMPKVDIGGLDTDDDGAPYEAPPPWV